MRRLSEARVTGFWARGRDRPPCVDAPVRLGAPVRVDGPITLTMRRLATYPSRAVAGKHEEFGYKILSIHREG